jgi:hypothetical protein
MQEPVLGHPPLLIHEDAVHHGNLPGRATEAQGCDPHPDLECLGDCGVSPAFQHGSFGDILFHRYAITSLVWSFVEGQL